MATRSRERRLGLHQVWPPDARNTSTIDIIAIHGLGTESPGTWVFKKDGREVNWLADRTMLPEAVPSARIFTYDWNANHFEDAPVQTLLGHADSLLAHAKENQSSSKRPIVFVASCFGGLVLAEALTRAAQEGSPYRQVLLSTAGIVFLATPFQGADAHREAQWQVTVGGIMGEETSDSLVRDLDREHDFVLQRVQKFAEVINADSIRLPVHCFYETKKTEMLRRVLPSAWAAKLSTSFTHKILVSESSACLHGFPRHGLNATHSGMNKFDGPDSSNFKVVKAAIQELVKNTPSVLGRREHVQPPSLWLVPFEQNKSFVGRDAILQELVEKADPYADAEHTQRVAVEGLGGVGKTQIALEAACRIRDKHPDCSVFWVPAVDATSFENAYREIGCELQVKGIDEEKADVKQLVKAALSRQDFGRWLLVVDNADDTKLLLDKTTSSLAQYLPTSKNGSILLTTRNHEVAVDLVDTPAEDIIPVGEMSDTEARELLTRGLGDEQVRDALSITNLLDFLANLPLAIKQATAYIAKTGTTIARYLDHCRSSNESTIKLLSRDFEDRSRYKGIKNPVATTWFISFDHISRDNPLAAQYLVFLCFLAEKDIPASLLPRADDDMEADEAIGALKAYAFITQREGGDSFDMHRLVRLAMQNWLGSKGEQAECALKAVQRVDEAFPWPEHENRNMWIKYLPHAQSVLQFRRVMVENEEAEPALLLSKVGESFSILGKYNEAEVMYHEALQLYEKILGCEHPLTLDSMDNLGLVLRHQGKYDEAEAMHHKALQLREKTLGHEHPSTLNSMNNLGLLLLHQGKYDEAKAIHHKALQLREKTLGHEHPSTLNSMNNLGLVLLRQGKYDEAEAMHRKALQLREKTLGYEHPLTLNSIDNLGLVLLHQRKYDEAKAMHHKALQLREKTLGHEHPSTLDSMDNLGLVLRHQGKYDEAEAMHRKALQLREKTLGYEHPSTLNSMNNLALVLKCQGKYDEAEVINREVLKLREKVLGCDHPSMLMSMNDLAGVLDSQGKYGEAEAMRRRRQEMITGTI